MRELVLDDGANLFTGSLRVYYGAPTLNGTVDNLANLVPIA